MSTLKELIDKQLIESVKKDLGPIEVYDPKYDKKNKIVLLVGLGTTALAAIFIGPIVAIGSGVGTLIYYFKK